MKGYKKEEVDILIAQLQDTIRQNGTKIYSLEDKLFKVQETVEEKNRMIDFLTKELDRLTHKIDGLEKNMSYLEQYFTDEDSPSHKEGFLDEMIHKSEFIEEQAKKTLLNLQMMKADMKSTFDKYLNQTDQLEEQTKELEEQAGSISQYYLSYYGNQQGSEQRVKKQSGHFRNLVGYQDQKEPFGQSEGYSFPKHPWERTRRNESEFRAPAQPDKAEVPDSEVLKEYINTVNSCK